MKEKLYKAVFKLTIILFMTICVTIHAVAQTTNYTGDWKVNLQLSDFGSQPTSYAPVEIKINQSLTGIRLERTVGIAPQVNISVEQLQFGGSPTESTVSGRKKIGSVKWSEDKKSLIETAQYSWTDPEGNEGNFKSTETYTLSEDNKTLVCIRNVVSTDVNFSIKAIYNKN
ncbi:MAG TPA: hypothetical protein VNW95_09455 [Mucilaginibacter sp.]|jgi:hypothetical protein|nr:hypothetical protein [Mucilaginibacter sp.]